jgi:methylglutaconyl-CoA hydratase
MQQEDHGSVIYRSENHIGTVEFYHPKGNSLPGNILRELAETITKAGKSEENNVLVIQSRGDGAFCAGASFDELIAISDEESGKRFFMGFAHVINAMRTCPLMIVSRVHGKTVGGGVGIVAASDFSVAHKSASVKLSEISVGIGPFVVGPAVGRRLGGSAFSTLALDSKEWYDAEWAANNGLYSCLVESREDLDREVSRIANDLATSNPDALKELKKILWQSTGHWDVTLEQRAEISGRLVLSEFTRNFLRDFKSKK